MNPKNSLQCLLCAIAVASGCAVDATDELPIPEGDGELVAVGDKADSTIPVPGDDRRLVFYVDNQRGLSEFEQWATSYAGQTQLLIGGTETTIQVYPQRFPRCGVAGEVVSFVMAEDGTIQEIPLRSVPYRGFSVMAGTFRVPDEGNSVQVWHRSRNGSCEEWDSAYGANYRFPMRAWRPTRIELRKDVRNPLVEGEERSLDGEIAISRGGGVLAIDYDGSRLPHCDFPETVMRPFGPVGVHRHMQVIVEYDNGHVDRSSGYYDPSVKRMFSVVPEGARSAKLYVWSEAISDSYSDRFCLMYDSNDGRDFRFRFTD